MPQKNTDIRFIDFRAFRIANVLCPNWQARLYLIDRNELANRNTVHCTHPYDGLQCTGVALISQDVPDIGDDLPEYSAG
jgi:hypothetical protein